MSKEIPKKQSMGTFSCFKSQVVHLYLVGVKNIATAPRPTGGHTNIAVGHPLTCSADGNPAASFRWEVLEVSLIYTKLISETIRVRLPC